MGKINHQRKSHKYTRRSFIQTSLLATAGVVVYGCVTAEPLVKVFQLPKRFSRRYGELTANICGSFSSQVRKAQYSLNDGQWIELPQGKPRVPSPLFTIELKAEEMQRGINQLSIKAINQDGQSETTRLTFEYDSTPISVPIKVDWSNNSDLDVQDGYWETFEVDGSWRVRPKPGFEEYDRILNVTGAFSGGRRIETDLIFRTNAWWMKGGRRDYGFGVLPLWGGHLDDEGIRPRRGWLFGLGWYWKPREGLELSFSKKIGDDSSPPSVSSIQKYKPKTNVRYFLTIECFPELDSAGQYLYRQRMKWWAEGDPEPNQWMELSDDEETPLIAPGEYAVALLAHRTQVDFGSVTVTPL